MMLLQSRRRRAFAISLASCCVFARAAKVLPHFRGISGVVHCRGSVPWLRFPTDQSDCYLGYFAVCSLSVSITQRSFGEVIPSVTFAFPSWHVW